MNEDFKGKSLKLKVRFDYRGTVKPSRFFLGTKNTEKVAEETREQQVALLRNVPLQGIRIEDIDTSFDVYHVFDEQAGSEVAYAPVEVVVQVDSLEEVLRFILREEFRKVEVLEPQEYELNRYQLERLLFTLHTEMRNYVNALLRRSGA